MDVTRAVERVSHRHYQVDSSLVALVAGDPSLQANQGQTRAYRRPGRTGVRVSGIETGSLGRALGLRNGDVITEVDGERVVSLDDASQALTSLRQEGAFTVKVQRGKHRRTLNYDVN